MPRNHNGAADGTTVADSATFTISADVAAEFAAFQAEQAQRALRATADAERAVQREKDIDALTDALSGRRVLTPEEEALIESGAAEAARKTLEQKRATYQQQRFNAKLKTEVGGLPCKAAFKFFGTRTRYVYLLKLGGKCDSKLHGDYAANHSLVRDALRDLVNSGVIALSSKAITEWAQAYVITGKFFSSGDQEATPLKLQAIESAGDSTPVVEYDGDLDADRM